MLRRRVTTKNQQCLWPLYAKLACFATVVGLAGCDAPTANFRADRLYLDKIADSESAEVSPGQKEDINVALTALFGTPDEPTLPGGDSGIADLIDIDNLAMAAGPVMSDRMGKAHGLYRQHCSHCHGVSGDGKGPTARFLNPYPRDYRRGVYKFKSTPSGSRPTHDDLKTILHEGIAGTAMPSFALLPDSEIEALVDYVKYLSIRGEMERKLVDEVCMELDEDDRLINDESLADSGELLLEDMLGSVVKKWADAESKITPIPKRPEMDNDQMLASIQRGKGLFYGTVANCTKCHGDSQLGDGQLTDYDDWVKDYAEKWIKQTDTDEEGAAKKAELFAHIEALDGLPPRTIKPRNLREGVYRGGRRPVDIYRRILNGIEGSPMPAAMMRKEGEATGLLPNDIWDIVNYVHSLPYESMTTVGDDAPIYSRPRM